MAGIKRHKYLRRVLPQRLREQIVHQRQSGQGNQARQVKCDSTQTRHGPAVSLPAGERKIKELESLAEATDQRS